MQADKYRRSRYLLAEKESLRAVYQRRIYETFGLRNWNSPQAQIRQCIEQSSTYQVDPAALERSAEQRLRELMGVG
jgi:hypothetical protein